MTKFAAIDNEGREIGTYDSRDAAAGACQDAAREADSDGEGYTVEERSVVGALCDYRTGDAIRPATPEEANASREQATRDGGRGVIEVDGRSCYVEPTETETVHCACGAWTGECCEWSGPASETVLVEYMSDQHRASHTAARNHGQYPHNGAVRVRVERSCAEAMLADEDQRDWARIVE